MMIKIPALAPSNRKCMRPNGTWYVNPEAERFDAIVAESTKGQKAPDCDFYAVSVTVSPRGPGSKLSARVKQTFDALTRCGFWKDDSQVVALVLKYGAGVKPETKVSVREAKLARERKTIHESKF